MAFLGSNIGIQAFLPFLLCVIRLHEIVPVLVNSFHFLLRCLDFCFRVLLFRNGLFRFHLELFDYVLLLLDDEVISLQMVCSRLSLFLSSLHCQCLSNHVLHFRHVIGI